LKVHLFELKKFSPAIGGGMGTLGPLPVYASGVCVCVRARARARARVRVRVRVRVCVCVLRQGSVISPDILNVFMNNFIIQLRLLNIGCHVGSMFLCCFVICR